MVDPTPNLVFWFGPNLWFWPRPKLNKNEKNGRWLIIYGCIYIFFHTYYSSLLDNFIIICNDLLNVYNIYTQKILI